MAYVSHTAGPSRYFDHVYDPTFEVSSQKDVWKANFQALQRSAPIQITSLFQTMFSDMPNRPSFMYWRRQNALPHFTHPDAVRPTSCYTQSTQQRKDFCVEGNNRCNFFHYPPDCAKTLNLRLCLPAKCKCLETPRNKFENVGCQTIYRESSAQTRPYEPDFYIAEGEPQTPEVVRIANFITDAKSPGEYDTLVIERLRKRRQWDKELPPTKSVNEWGIRQTILEAFEWEEFLAREEDIQQMQELRMELVRSLVARREASIRASSAARLKHVSQRIEEERKEKLKKLNNKYSRQLRKLDCAHNKISRKYKAQNIVKEHMDQASDLYAPQMRFGVHPKRLHFVPFNTSFQARLEGLDTRKIEAKKLKCTVKKYDQLAQPKPPVTEIEKGFNNDKHLTKLYETLMSLRNLSVINKNLPNCLQKVHKEKVMATETPVGPSEDTFESSETYCCVYIQKITKGRALQKLLYSGRDRCRGLIQEIQTTHMLSAVSAMYPGMSNNTIRGRLTIQSQQKRFTQKIQHEKQSSDIFRESEAGIVGVLLEFLEKELRRMYEQRKIHALCILAERERMKREAAEAGRRQTENRRRQESEEVYRHMMKASQDTVSLYLENLLVDETEKVAEDEARKRIKASARYIDHKVSATVDSKCQPIETEENDHVIDDLVKNFMFPEVHKRIARNNMDQKRRRHLLAAHEALYGHIKNVFYTPTPRSSRSEITSHILNTLIDKVLSSESVLSKIGRRENVAQHEAMAAIRRIIKRIFPDRKWKTSAERIASATVSELIHDVFEEKPQEGRPLKQEESWLQDIIKDISTRLWKYAQEEEDISFDKDVVPETREAEPKLTFAEYELSEMAEDRESLTFGDSKDFIIPHTFTEPHFFDVDSSEDNFAPFVDEHLNDREQGAEISVGDSENKSLSADIVEETKEIILEASVTEVTDTKFIQENEDLLGDNLEDDNLEDNLNISSNIQQNLSPRQPENRNDQNLKEESSPTSDEPNQKVEYDEKEITQNEAGGDS